MKAHSPDYPFIITVFILVIFGLVVLYSASMVISYDKFNQTYYYLKHQLLYSLPLALICFLIVQKIHYKHWQKLALPFLLVTIFLLALIFVPGLGYGRGETRRWISVAGLSLQPFEFVKISFILYLAALLSKKRKDDQEAIKKSLLPFIIALSIISLLVLLQPNMSALFILISISAVIYFLAGLKINFIPILLLIGIIGFFILVKIAPYRIDRLTIFLHPEMDPQGKGYQINQARLAIGSGGLWGLGLIHSVQKWKYLPEVIGDSIFAIIAEELGFLGASVVIILFIILAWRGFLIAKRAPDKFGYLAAGGITSWFFFQVFINIAAISGLAPLTGMPLPFISYGGSSLIATFIGVGILVNISKYC